MKCGSKAFNVLCKAALNDSKVLLLTARPDGLPGILKGFFDESRGVV